MGNIQDTLRLSIQDNEDDIKSFRPEAEKFEVLLQKQSKQLNLWAFKFEQWLRSYNFVRFHRNWLQYLQNAEHIYFTGIGKNQPIAEKTANMMRSVGIKAHYFDITNALHGDLGVLSKNDVVVGISKSGKTVELANAFKYLKDNSICTTLIVSLDIMTNIPSDSTLVLPMIQELDDFDKIPTNSNLAFQMFFDILTMYMTKDLTLKQFLHNHPGGEIGKSLKHIE